MSRRDFIGMAIAGFTLFVLAALVFPQVPSRSPVSLVRYDGAQWNLKGDGIVCCPCAVPCPCRSNAAPSYGHCESTLYLRVRSGQYAGVDLSGAQLVRTGGMCAVDNQKLSALYFDESLSPHQRDALMKLMASFSPSQTADFAYTRAARFDAAVTNDHLFKVLIPGVFEMIVDRNWGQPSPPVPMVAAQDDFSNLIQYAQNIRYRMSDDGAGLHFNYSRRQANYRAIDLAMEQYRSHSMLIQFADGSGWFSPRQMDLIRAQHLNIPQLDAIRKQAQILSAPGIH